MHSCKGMYKVWRCHWQILWRNIV